MSRLCYLLRWSEICSSFPCASMADDFEEVLADEAIVLGDAECKSHFMVLLYSRAGALC